MDNKNQSIIALILGIAAVIIPLFIWIIGMGGVIISLVCLVAAIVAIVLGAKGMKTPETKNMCTAALVLGIIGIITSIIGMSCGAVTCIGYEAMKTLGSTADLGELEDALNSFASALE